MPLGEMYSRAQWGAKPAKKTAAWKYVGSYGVLHYEGADPKFRDQAAEAAHMRSLQQDAFNRGYRDFQYNFAVFESGNVYEGCGMEVQSTANGTTDSNAHAPSVLYVDGPDIDTVTPAAALPLIALWQTIARRFPLMQKVIGHRNVPGHSYTGCPGDACLAFLPTINAHLHDVPAQPTKVTPMFNPSLVLEPLAAELRSPNGGVWLLATSGALYAFGGAPGIRGANGQPYFVGRTAARLEPFGNGVTIVATSGERYDYPVA